MLKLRFRHSYKSDKFLNWSLKKEIISITTAIKLKIRSMNKKINPKDNQSNQQNPNKNSEGTNKQYDQAQGNTGKQKNQIRRANNYIK